jgi:hypothetical protein
MVIKVFGRSRRSSVSVMFAAAAIPFIGLIGLAVDFGIWNQTNAQLSVAANVAAMTAVKIAANAQLAGDPNATAEGQTAGASWFQAEVGNAVTGDRIGTKGVTGLQTLVTVTPGATVTALVNYSGNVPSVFGAIFGRAQYGISGEAAAAVTSAPYLNVEMLIDISSSMDIGATVHDMQLLNNISACDPSNAVYATGQQSYDAYNSYAYSAGSQVYDGTLTTPAVATNGTTTITLNQASGTVQVGPPCTGILAPVNNVEPTAGPPCAFACHWDSSHNNGLANDLYGMARRTLATANPIQLRMDIVKNATNQVLQAMQTDDLSINNLNVGIFTFATNVTRVYPASGEAGDNWATAMADVGTPPTTPLQSETGILPTIGVRQGFYSNNNNDTDFPEAMATLTSTYLTTSSGDGTTALKPRKVLFIITDGFLDDHVTGARSAINPANCNTFKNMGYTIYVIYTPYYPVQHISYLTENWKELVETNNSDSITYNLNACSSSPNGTTSDFIAATDGPSLAAALQSFLKAALNQPARFTM